MSLLIKNGEIVTASERYTADILCENETITRIDRGITAPKGAEVIDAKGKFVFPGFIDPHVHIYLPFMGTFSKDTYVTGSQAALVGGTTTLIEMCCPSRKDDALGSFELWMKQAVGKSACDFSFHMGVTKFDDATEKQLREIVKRGISSFKVFLAYKGAFGVDDTELYRTLKLAKELGVIVTAHCENETLVAERQKELLAAGKTDTGQHYESRPPAVEAEGVHHLMTFAELTGAAAYIVHLSCKEALDEAIAARQRGVRVTVETLIQYLTLDKTYAEKPKFEGSKYVMSPPLRDKRNQQILWNGLRDGLVQTVATDHCPFDFKTQKPMGKDDFTKIPNGIPSLEERVNLLYTYGVKAGKIDLHTLVNVANTQVAKTFDLFPRKGAIQPGADADLVVFDPDYRGKISAKTQHTNVDYNAFEGWKIEGRPSVVTVRGEVAARDGKFVGKIGRGNSCNASRAIFKPQNKNCGMITHHVKVYPSKTALPKMEQLAWKLAAVAADKSPILPEAAEMAANRVIDNASVAIAAINRSPVANARTQALAHPRADGATLFGVPGDQRFESEWAAWANGVAVRELDMHDTFLAADYSHPGDNIPALLAVAQQTGRSGADLLRGIVVAYEIQINLVRGICLHEFKKDHIAHLCPSVAAGLGAMLGLETDTIYQAIQQAVHVGFSTRQSRKGEISSWKAYAPAHAGKLAIEAVDRAMRGEKSPSPIYEGEDSVIAWMLGGAKAAYDVPLPALGESCRAILDSYTKQHSAEYQAQAWIDLAFRLRGRIPDLRAIKSATIHTSHHTHYVIGSGANDPQKYDSRASRETLDHSLMFIFAAALHTGFWHHVKSYAPEVVQHPQVVELWNKIKTVEDPEWTRRYHSANPSEKAFGGRVEIVFSDGRRLAEEIAVADAHPLGAKPFARGDYIAKFQALTEDIISSEESGRFIDVAQRLAGLTAAELKDLNVILPPGRLTCATRDKRGIF